MTLIAYTFMVNKILNTPYSERTPEQKLFYTELRQREIEANRGEK